MVWIHHTNNTCYLGCLYFQGDNQAYKLPRQSISSAQSAHSKGKVTSRNHKAEQADVSSVSGQIGTKHNPLRKHSDQQTAQCHCYSQQISLDIFYRINKMQYVFNDSHIGVLTKEPREHKSAWLHSI